MQNLYFLWSLERVGVLYDLPLIGDKDWYRWGAEILVANQQPQGSWTNGGYAGAEPPIDTSLALLFLKRAILVQHLGKKLKLDRKAVPASSPGSPGTSSPGSRYPQNKR
jgi:hypothetical protein